MIKTNIASSWKDGYNAGIYGYSCLKILSLEKTIE